MVFFQDIVYSSRKIEEMIQFDQFFSDGLVQPPSTEAFIGIQAISADWRTAFQWAGYMGRDMSWILGQKCGSSN